MIGRRRAGTFAAALLLAVSASAQPTAPGVLLDPLGDLIWPSVTEPDGIAFSGHAGQDYLELRIALVDPWAGPAAGLVEIDADRDPETGAVSHIGLLCPAPTGLGVERTVDLFHADAGLTAAPLRDETFAVVGSVPMELRSDELVLWVPLALLGGGPVVHAAALVGTPAAATDCLPDGGFLVTASSLAVPEIPGAGAAGLMVLASLLGFLGLSRLWS